MSLYETDGAKTADMLKILLGVEVTAQDAITIEHTLFASLKARAEKAEAELAEARKALSSIIKSAPAGVEGGNCFYPMHDGNGEYLGEQHLDPLDVISFMVQTAQVAIDAARKEGR